MTFVEALQCMIKGAVIYRENRCCEYHFYILKEGKLYNRIGGCNNEWKEGCFFDENDVLANDWEFKNW